MKAEYRQNLAYWFTGPFLWIGLFCLLAGCTGGAGRPVKNDSDQPENHSMYAEYSIYNGTTRNRFSGSAGQTLVLDYKLDIQAGDMKISLLGPLGIPLWRQEFTESTTGQVKIPIRIPSRYTVEVFGSQARGSYDVHWDLTTTSSDPSQ